MYCVYLHRKKCGGTSSVAAGVACFTSTHLPCGRKYDMTCSCIPSKRLQQSHSRSIKCCKVLDRFSKPICNINAAVAQDSICPFFCQRMIFEGGVPLLTEFVCDVGWSDKKRKWDMLSSSAVLEVWVVEPSKWGNVKSRLSKMYSHGQVHPWKASEKQRMSRTGRAHLTSWYSQASLDMIDADPKRK